MQLPEKLAYRAAELCEALSISRTTLWRLTRAGVLPAPVRLGGVALWCTDDVRDALRRLREQQQRDGGER